MEAAVGVVFEKGGVGEFIRLNCNAINADGFGGFEGLFVLVLG